MLSSSVSICQNFKTTCCVCCFKVFMYFLVFCWVGTFCELIATLRFCHRRSHFQWNFGKFLQLITKCKHWEILESRITLTKCNCFSIHSRTGLIRFGTVRGVSCLLTAPIFTVLKADQSIWPQPHRYHSSQFNPQSGCHGEGKPIVRAPHWAGPPMRIWRMTALANHKRYYHVAYPWGDVIAK